MRKIFLIVVLFVFLCLFFNATAKVGKVDLITGKPQVIRDNKSQSARIRMDILNGDAIKTGVKDKIIIDFGDNRKINIKPESKVNIKDVLSEINKEKDWFKPAWQKLAKLMKDNEQNYYRVTAVTGVRGMPNEMAIKRWIEWIDKYISENKDSDKIPGLLLIKAEYYNNIGDKAQAISEYQYIINKYNQNPEAAIARNKIKLLNSISWGTITVLPVEGSDRELSEMITGIIINDLAGSGQISLVERKDIDKIMKELALNVSGAVDEQKAVKIGKIADAEYILLGNYSITGEKIIINMRLVEVESGKIIKGFTVEGNKNSPEFYSHQIAFTIHRHLTGYDIPEQDLVGKIDTEKNLKGTEILLGVDREGIPPEYNAGEKMKIRFKVLSKEKKEYYVAIINISSEGDVNILYPNQNHQDNKITANKVYEIPGEGDEFELEVYGAPGKSVIIGIATEKPVYLWDKEQIKNELFPQIKENPDNYIRGGIVAKLKQADIKNWIIGKIHFVIK